MADETSILRKMEQNAKENGYYLCPDNELFQFLIDGLVVNEERYGYGSCPCRVASGIKQHDIDIICPCEYRDADVNAYGMCYCGLFVTNEIKKNPSKMGPIPERRPLEIQEAAQAAAESEKNQGQQKSKQLSSKSVIVASEIPVWRCTICGYLCARELPPPICPICKAKAERFERFDL